MTDATSAYRSWLGHLTQVEMLEKLFIIGCPKSGTTWLMNMLAAHPQIVINGEGKFGWTLMPALMQVIDQYNADLDCESARFRDLEKLGLLRTAANAVLARYLEEKAKTGGDLSGVRVVGDKTPQHTVGVGLLSSVMPEARFVHVVRDPRDAATSAWFHLGRGGSRSFEAYVKYFMTEVWPLQAGSAHAAGARLGDRYLEVRYEDLHREEEYYVTKIMQFSGVDPSSSIVLRCREAGDFRRLTGGRPRGETADVFYRRGVVGDWVNHLPSQLVNECCAEIEGLMRVFSYQE